VYVTAYKAQFTKYYLRAKIKHFPDVLMRN